MFTDVSRTSWRTRQLLLASALLATLESNLRARRSGWQGAPAEPYNSLGTIVTPGPMWWKWRQVQRARWLMQAEAQGERAPSGVSGRERILRKARIFLDAIKFEHTIFALPFAYLGMALAARANHGWPGLDKLIWITLADRKSVV